MTEGRGDVKGCLIVRKQIAHEVLVHKLLSALNGARRVVVKEHDEGVRVENLPVHIEQLRDTSEPSVRKNRIFRQCVACGIHKIAQIALSWSHE